MKNLTIIGGGPAALMLASTIDTEKFRVTIYDQKKSVGRKFLVAGEGGLNLTFNSELDSLIGQYSPSEFIEQAIRAFSNKDLKAWLKKLDIPTFVGSSNRVFPEKGIKPIDVLNAIVADVKNNGVEFRLNTKWLGWNEKGNLRFDGIDEISSDITVFALGGASWKVTGSDGNWAEIFEDKGIQINPFRAANCAFEVKWQKEFILSNEAKPLKNIALSFNDKRIKGELVISSFGLEGNAIYPLSEKIQNSLAQDETTIVNLDLKPAFEFEQVLNRLNNTRQRKITDVLKKELNLDRTQIAILKHFTTKNTFSNNNLLAEAIKALPIHLYSAGPIDEAISTLGGIDLNEVNNTFELKKVPNSFTIGEMLDWYAPTGGYLLQGCFSMGYYLGKQLNKV